MTLHLTGDQLSQIQAHGEVSYPDEGAGFLLGKPKGEERKVQIVVPAKNTREAAARSNRYTISPEETLEVENTARNLNLDILGVFHSHPDHPNQPSEFDRENALPWFTYVITTIAKGKAVQTRAWRLQEDREKFIEEAVVIEENAE